MPCRSDYLAPSTRETELNRAAKLLVWLRKKRGCVIPDWLLHEAAGPYGSDPRNVTILCRMMQESADIPESDDREALDLKLWWHDHQAADADREAKEAA